MAKINYSNRSLEDLERISDFLSISGANELETLDLIAEAINLLTRHPLIGRKTNAGLRELVISQGHTGYVALYSYESVQDTILVLSIRHQREAGFRDV